MEAPLLRALDASANRALEGLRVVEDYVRFVLDDRYLTQTAKAIRHELARLVARLPHDLRHAARDSTRDVGTTIDMESSSRRETSEGVVIAALARSKEAVRSLEEFTKLVDIELASAIEDVRYRIYTLEKATTNTWTSRCKLDAVKLYVIVDGASCGDDFEQLIRALLEAGVDAIQLRAKQLPDRLLLERARQLVNLVRDRPTLAIVNDRVDVAKLAGADGLHVGQDDITVHDARKILGTDAVVGVSTHSLEQIEAAVLSGANYVGVGPTFPTPTKEFAEFPGLPLLQAATAEITLPMFAIGGINAQNIGDVLGTGMGRVAVSSAVTAAPDAGQAARHLRELLGPAKTR